MLLVTLCNEGMTEWHYVIVPTLGDAVQTYPGFFVWSVLPYTGDVDDQRN